MLLIVFIFVNGIDFEWFLASNGVIHDSELTENPRSLGDPKQVKKWNGSRRRLDDDDVDEDSD